MNWMEILGLAANIMQVISFVPLILGAYYFITRGRQLDRRLKALAKMETNRPAALAIGLGQDIEQAVKQHLKDNNLDMEVVSITQLGMITPSQYPDLLKSLQEVKQKLSDTGITELNVFYKGPVTFATAMGSMLHNWVPLKIYNFNEGRYQLEFLLTKDMIVAPK